MTIKTTRDMMSDCNDNIGWCKPYFSPDGSVAFVSCEETITGLLIDGVDVNLVLEGLEWKIPAAEIARAALKLGADPAEPYYDPQDYLYEVCRESPCRLCPWNAQCEVMDEAAE